MNSELASTRVEIRNLHRRYREGGDLHTVLDGLDARFARGETVAIRGRSGSGKSTLLNLIGGIDAPDEGEVEVDGEVITALSERDRTLWRRRHVGFVYQAFNLVPTLNVRDNVRLVLELNGFGDPEAKQRVNDALAAVGLADRSKAWPELLSGGEQQRVAIARALAHRPSLVLADEPTGNLDDRTTEEILALLDSLVRHTGGTMLVATHSARVAAFCDRTVELRDGRLLSGPA
ncbi:MAG TPA: ABC transporter ATP-binding protein [Woeseiaceae bacterium]|nr:ABC transporter ATP-binding protein [Woeseiaceae bacterium]